MVIYLIVALFTILLSMVLIYCPWIRCCCKGEKKPGYLDKRRLKIIQKSEEKYKADLQPAVFASIFGG